MNHPHHTPKTDTLARHVAAEILHQMLTTHTPLDVCLLRNNLYSGLSSENKAFALRLMHTYLRHKGQADVEISGFLERPLPADHIVKLHMGLAMVQMAAMDIPPYAAVNIAVELAKSVSEKYGGLVNAVLNKWVKQGAGFQSGLLANIPDWLKEKWQTDYSDQAVQHLAEILVTEPPVDLSFKSPGMAAKLNQSLSERGSLIGDSLRLFQPGQISNIAGYVEGDWWVQDMAASFPAMLFGDVNGKRILDMCAAPGGKTMQLASNGAKVTALDSSKKRLAVMQENLNRIGLDVELIEKDALKYTPEVVFDGILLDAPCSATGTLRRNPDVLYTKTSKNLLEIAEKQQKLLNKAYNMIPHGGILVYAVCSMEPEEGERQIERLLNQHSNIIVSLEDIKLPLILERSEFGLRALPGAFRDIGGIDGFFMTRLVKLP